MRGMRTLAAGVAAFLVAATCTASGHPPVSEPKPERARSVGKPYRVELPPLGPSQTVPPTALRAELRDSAAPESRRAKPEGVTRISGYVYCGSAVVSAQRCIDGGSLTLYHPAGVRTLAGHNYMGWAWMDDLPVGRKVVITSGALAGTYRVYGHGWAQRGSRGGRFPASGLGASVALQTCTSTGTGFSFLRRI